MQRVSGGENLVCIYFGVSKPCHVSSRIRLGRGSVGTDGSEVTALHTDDALFIRGKLSDKQSSSFLGSSDPKNNLEEQNKVRLKMK